MSCQVQFAESYQQRRFVEVLCNLYQDLQNKCHNSSILIYFVHIIFYIPKGYFILFFIIILFWINHHVHTDLVGFLHFTFALYEFCLSTCVTIFISKWTTWNNLSEGYLTSLNWLHIYKSEMNNIITNLKWTTI